MKVEEYCVWDCPHSDDGECRLLREGLDCPLLDYLKKKKEGN